MEIIRTKLTETEALKLRDEIMALAIEEARKEEKDK